MSPLRHPEPSKTLEKLAFIKAPKFSFHLEKIELPIGIKSTFGLIRHPGASLAVPITNDGQVILLRQYRFAVEQRILEFPAGTLESNEEPLTAMKRELGEETGYEASNWDSLGEMFPCPGYSDEIIHLFLARNLTPIKDRPKGDDDEDIEIIHMTKEELNSSLLSGSEILDGKSVTAWFKACKILNNNLKSIDS